MEINKEELKKWITALRSGNFNQSSLKLQSKWGYCCLGVACKVLIPQEKLKFNFQGLLYGGTPEDQPHSPKWLGEINKDLFEKTGRSLTNLNDTDKLSFNQIADELEKYYLIEEKSNQ